MPTVVTANDLRSGSVVYLHHSGSWVSRLEQAYVAESPEDVERMKRAALAAVERCEVTSVYAFDVSVVDGRPEPISVRERLRAAYAIAA